MHTKPVVNIVTGSTLHAAIKEHVIVDGVSQSAHGGGGREESSVTGGQSIGIVKGDGVLCTQVIAGHASDSCRRIDEVGSGSVPPKIFKCNSSIMTAEA